ncbi:MAG: hypothetical protein R3E32_10070 [Chitinophagales bacterium]
MIFETTYQDKDIIRTINQHLGNSYSLWQRFKMGGIGSKRMMVEQYSAHFTPYFSMDADISYANIELRPKGILIHFNKRLHQFSWIIPYHHLEISQKDCFGIHGQYRFILFKKNRYFTENIAFINRLMILKEEFLSIFIE